MNSNNKIALIGHLNASDSYQEESINTLQFTDRTKNIDLKGKFFGDELGMGQGGSGSDKIIKKLNEELHETRSKIENKQRVNHNKLILLNYNLYYLLILLINTIY